MDIIFTRGEGRAYTTVALRDDGVLLCVPCGDRTFSLPHDIAHYVVEHGLGLKRGFWGRVAAGAIYPGMKMLSGRQPVHAAEKSRLAIREAEQQGVAAEVMVGVMLEIVHKGLDTDWPMARALLGNEWSPRRPEREPPTAEEVKRVCAALREAEQRWQALKTGEDMMVTWPCVQRKRR